MKSRTFHLLMLICFAASTAMAQEDARTPLVVTLSDGGFVGFKTESAASQSGQTLPASKLNTAVRSQVVQQTGRLLHRVLTDAKGRPVFGYDLEIEPDVNTRKFLVQVRPLNLEFESSLTLGTGGTGRIATLPRAGEPQMLDDGDSFLLDLLVNQESGVKIVDVVRVAFDRAALWRRPPPSPPRDFTLDAVVMRFKAHQLLVNGKPVSAGKPNSEFAGNLIWFYAEGHGRFIFSLVPRDGYDFRKIGTVAADRLEFEMRGNYVEWISQAPILSNGGVWHLWVLHDPHYKPFGNEQAEIREEAGRWEQIESAIVAADRAIRGRHSSARARASDADSATEPSRGFRVMVGAADRIENLWPKN